jgi:hypothetical protein
MKRIGKYLHPIKATKREREREKSLFFNTIRLLFFSAFQPWESKDI